MASKIFYLFLLFLAHSQPCTLVNGNLTLIKNTCKNTKYYDLCFSSLKSSLTSQKSDPKSLATIMLRIGIANATSTSSYLSSQFLGTSNDTTLKRVLKECAHKYAYAGEALEASAQDLANEVYDFAYMHVTAASDYTNVCHNLFKVHHGLVYPSEVALREDGLKHICDVALGIIDNLSW
ncbi:hypothetical protein Lal_00049638 [Lupinus albus]|uniref:Putative pectinesterase inhibitor domain-containing protein n=1 Tax=Lupinus albus TaxID=3870 RepID=A0A6A5M2M0_LUPAL|nr:putative pectinesterase inhibitor domain-containing protein [Lupinus albus]KAE9602778.1 putative pectinesterase inhibitor domain-containing protein [Lupinus albus]KAF1867209.1 hypothetical protein Lal_00049638 [Lupinus albus]